MSAPRSLLPAKSAKARPDLSLAIVNIVLLLILFFMVTGSFTAPRGTEVSLAETEDLPIDSLPRPILILEPGGGMTLDGEPVDPALLGTVLNGAPLLHVLIDRDRSAFDLLDLLARDDLGDPEIRLVTLHRRGAP